MYCNIVGQPCIRLPPKRAGPTTQAWPLWSNRVRAWIAEFVWKRKTTVLLEREVTRIPWVLEGKAWEDRRTDLDVKDAMDQEPVLEALLIWLNEAENQSYDGNCTKLLMDFGLAGLMRDDGHSSSREHFLGTPAYMSPELVRGETADARSDIYGVGVLLYELLARRPPFNAPLEELLVKIAQEEPPRPRELRPEVDPDLEAICLKATAKNPADRFQSAAELVEAFQQYIEDHPVGERPPATRRAWFWFAAVVASLVVLAGLVIHLQTDEDAVESDVPSHPVPSDYQVTTWYMQDELTASDGAEGHRFGQTVSISGNWAIVGATNVDSKYGSSLLLRTGRGGLDRENRQDWGCGSRRILACLSRFRAITRS